MHLGGGRKHLFKRSLFPCLDGLDFHEQVKQPFILPPNLQVFLSPVRKDVVPGSPFDPVAQTDKPVLSPDVQVAVVLFAFRAIAEMICSLKLKDRRHIQIIKAGLVPK